MVLNSYFYQDNLLDSQLLAMAHLLWIPSKKLRRLLMITKDVLTASKTEKSGLQKYNLWVKERNHRNEKIDFN